jgi:hypothetical protein
MLEFLSQVRSLQELSITVVDATNYDTNTWSEMDRLLEYPKFSDLRRVTIYHLRRDLNIEAYLEEKLATCAVRGILRVFSP